MGSSGINKAYQFHRRVTNMNTSSGGSTFLIEDLDKNDNKKSEFSNILSNNLVDLKRKSIKQSIIEKFKNMKYSWHEIYNISKANMRLINEMQLRTKYLRNVSETTFPIAICICKNDFNQQELCRDKQKRSQY